VSGEADATVWLPVRDAVAGHETGELAMLPPTIESLRDGATVAPLLDRGRLRHSYLTSDGPVVHRESLVR
jgi:hypothetical protein